MRLIIVDNKGEHHDVLNSDLEKYVMLFMSDNNVILNSVRYKVLDLIDEMNEEDRQEFEKRSQLPI